MTQTLRFHTLRTIALVGLSIGILGVAKFAHADEGGHIKLQTIVQKEVMVTDAAGKTRRELVPAGKVTPGDEVVYTIYFENVQYKPVDNVEIVDAIPVHTQYKSSSAFGPGTKINFSVDGGQTFDRPENLKVARQDGTLRLATANDYSHVRWIYEPALREGQKAYVRFRAIVK